MLSCSVGMTTVNTIAITPLMIISVTSRDIMLSCLSILKPAGMLMRVVWFPILNSIDSNCPCINIPTPTATPIVINTTTMLIILLPQSCGFHDILYTPHTIQVSLIFLYCIKIYKSISVYL